jgi:predicted RNase H-like nuclease (RuvC/YqgF family)
MPVAPPPKKKVPSPDEQIAALRAQVKQQDTELAAIKATLERTVRQLSMMETADRNFAQRYEKHVREFNRVANTINQHSAAIERLVQAMTNTIQRR